MMKYNNYFLAIIHFESECNYLKKKQLDSLPLKKVDIKPLFNTLS